MQRYVALFLQQGKELGDSDWFLRSKGAYSAFLSLRASEAAAMTYMEERVNDGGCDHQFLKLILLLLLPSYSSRPGKYVICLIFLSWDHYLFSGLAAFFCVLSVAFLKVGGPR